MVTRQCPTTPSVRSVRGRPHPWLSRVRFQQLLHDRRHDVLELLTRPPIEAADHPVPAQQGGDRPQAPRKIVGIPELSWRAVQAPGRSVSLPETQGYRRLLRIFELEAGEH